MGCSLGVPAGDDAGVCCGLFCGFIRWDQIAVLGEDAGGCANRVRMVGPADQGDDLLAGVASVAEEQVVRLGNEGLLPGLLGILVDAVATSVFQLLSNSHGRWASRPPGGGRRPAVGQFTGFGNKLNFR